MRTDPGNIVSIKFGIGADSKLKANAFLAFAEVESGQLGMMVDSVDPCMVYFWVLQSSCGDY